MTQRIEPTNGSAVERAVSSRRLAAASRHGGSDWVVPETKDINASRDGELAAGPLGGFDRIDGDDSNQTVQFDTGEAFVGGAYVASDDNTASVHTVGPLPDNSTTTIYLGWDLSTADTLIIGPVGDFGTHDPRVELWEVTTDADSITSDADLRNTAPGNDSGDIIADTGLDADDTTILDLDTGTISNPYSQYEIRIARECATTAQNYMRCRVNGVSSGDYYFDYYDAVANGHDSEDGVSSFGRLAGTGRDTGGDTYGSAVAQQRIIIGLPQSIGFDTGDVDPLISTDVTGVGKNIDFLEQGNLNVGTNAVTRLELFSVENSTGRIQVRGIDHFQ